MKKRTKCVINVDTSVKMGQKITSQLEHEN